MEAQSHRSSLQCVDAAGFSPETSDWKFVLRLCDESCPYCPSGYAVTCTPSLITHLWAFAQLCLLPGAPLFVKPLISQAQSKCCLQGKFSGLKPLALPPALCSPPGLPDAREGLQRLLRWKSDSMRAPGVNSRRAAVETLIGHQDLPSLTGTEL